MPPKWEGEERNIMQKLSSCEVTHRRGVLVNKKTNMLGALTTDLDDGILPNDKCYWPVSGNLKKA